MITPTAVTWFAEMWDISELCKPWPFLTKPAQSYIASFETLAQFALLQSTYHVSGSYLQIQVPTGTDNTPRKRASTNSSRRNGRFAISSD